MLLPISPFAVLVHSQIAMLFEICKLPNMCRSNHGFFRESTGNEVRLRPTYARPALQTCSIVTVAILFSEIRRRVHFIRDRRSSGQPLVFYKFKGAE